MADPRANRCRKRRARRRLAMWRAARLIGLLEAACEAVGDHLKQFADLSIDMQVGKLRRGLEEDAARRLHAATGEWWADGMPAGAGVPFHELTQAPPGPPPTLESLQALWDSLPAPAKVLQRMEMHPSTLQELANLLPAAAPPFPGIPGGFGVSLEADDNLPAELIKLHFADGHVETLVLERKPGRG